MRFSEDGRADLDEIYEYSFSQFGEPRAEVYLQTIYDVALAVERGNKRGRPQPPARLKLLRIVCESHVIFYRIEDGEVVVVRVLHQAMNALRHLR